MNFKRLKTGLDCDRLLGVLLRHWSMFGDITARQTTPGSPHVDTETIFLRWCESQTVDAAFTEIPAVDYPAMKVFGEVVNPLVGELMAEVGSNELGRVLLVNLKPGGVITRHADEGAYADYYERFHVCLTSDEGNIFMSETEAECGEFVHMKSGELWWFNHKQPHWAMNHSKSPRLHLIVDCVAPYWHRERGIYGI